MCCVLATAATISYKKEFLFIEQKNRSKIWRTQIQVNRQTNDWIVFFYWQVLFHTHTYFSYFIHFEFFTAEICRTGRIFFSSLDCVVLFLSSIFHFLFLSRGGDHFSFICVINIMLTFIWKYFDGWLQPLAVCVYAYLYLWLGTLCLWVCGGVCMWFFFHLSFFFISYGKHFV